MKFIELTDAQHNEKFMVSVSVIKTIYSNRDDTLLITLKDDCLVVSESYEEVKRLIELASK